jgi:hypothetical protein
VSIVSVPMTVKRKRVARGIVVNFERLSELLRSRALSRRGGAARIAGTTRATPESDERSSEIAEAQPLHGPALTRLELVTTRRFARPGLSKILALPSSCRTAAGKSSPTFIMKKSRVGGRAAKIGLKRP